LHASEAGEGRDLGQRRLSEPAAFGEKSFKHNGVKETAVMSSGLVVLVGLSTLASGTDRYADAYRQTTKTGRPLVVLVSAEWCGACKTMEREVIPKMKQRGVFRRVSFARVDLDREKKLGRTLTRGGPIPQLLMFRRTRAGWRLSRLRGGQNARTVEAFIGRGLQRDERDKQAEKKQARGDQEEDGEQSSKGQAAESAA
jgi:thiol-disulfide isomerase/thioredoxin